VEIECSQDCLQESAQIRPTPRRVSADEIVFLNRNQEKLLFLSMGMSRSGASAFALPRGWRRPMTHGFIPGYSPDEEVVGQTGLEPVTPRLSSVCSNQLSYRPFVVLVEARGFEPRTSSLQSWRSTN
jgi:hypothetical protein